MTTSPLSTSVDLIPKSKFSITYEAEIPKSPVSFDMETNLNKFLEFVGSENIVGFVDFSEEIKGGDKYISISVEFVSDKEVLLNNRVVFLGDKDNKKLDESIAESIFCFDDGAEKIDCGVVYIVQSEDRLKLLIKYDSDAEEIKPSSVDASDSHALNEKGGV